MDLCRGRLGLWSAEKRGEDHWIIVLAPSYLQRAVRFAQMQTGARNRGCSRTDSKMPVALGARIACLNPPSLWHVTFRKDTCYALVILGSH